MSCHTLALVSVMLAVITTPHRAKSLDMVRISDFSIDRTEVTIEEFRKFLLQTKRITTAERKGGGFEYNAGWKRRSGWIWSSPYGTPGNNNEPAVHITWQEAKDYCASAGGRLPTFTEWKLSAYTEQRTKPTNGFVRGKTYIYPVGDVPDGMNNSRQHHVDVGTTKQGINGLYDMGANVWEWLADRQGAKALTAGGSWWYGPDMTRVSGAQWKPADFYAVYIGFRCAYDLKE